MNTLLDYISGKYLFARLENINYVPVPDKAVNPWEQLKDGSNKIEVENLYVPIRLLHRSYEEGLFFDIEDPDLQPLELILIDESKHVTDTILALKDLDLPQNDGLFAVMRYCHN